MRIPQRVCPLKNVCFGYSPPDQSRVGCPPFPFYVDIFLGFLLIIFAICRLKLYAVTARKVLGK